MPPTYKFFTAQEAKNMDPGFMLMANAGRDFSNVQFKVISGFRTKEHNAEIGGAPNSAHLRGCAFDVACDDPHTRFLMVKGLILAGFTRIEVSKDGHLHFDNGKEVDGYPQEWLEIE